MKLEKWEKNLAANCMETVLITLAEEFDAGADKIDLTKILDMALVWAYRRDLPAHTPIDSRVIAIRAKKLERMRKISSPVTATPIECQNN